MQKGNISIDAQNIMPVIKRWLYSDKDIFLREIVSNGVDAITKLRMVGGAVEGEELSVTVTLDKKKGEIRVSDNGIGMTREEVDQYINQVAFSSAEEFLKNYTGEDASGIIGHFGLGFYSAFMAADRVTIDTLSYREGDVPVRWVSEDGISYEMGEGSRTQRGTTITMHLMEEEKEFLEGGTVREVLEKYCGYMAVPVYFEDIEGIKQQEKDAAKRKKEEEKKKKKEDKDAGAEDSFLEDAEEEAIGPVLINEVHPLWLKAPKDCTDEEYKETYRKLFRTWEDPLFWVHLNVDYPFNLKGILYFPRIKRDFTGQDGQIKLFNRQVFVADNIKEVIPEFLMVLKGVIDCPDLPLNVSRSFLQNDGYVRRLSAHIVKKVADKLNSLFTNDRESYQKYWDDIHPFIKFGSISDRKFYDAVKGSLLLKTTKGDYLTLDEYKSRNGGKAEKKAYYTTDAARQAASVAPFEDKGIDVVVMDTLIDSNFMSFLEYSGGADLNFMRVDADIKGLQDETDEGKDLEQDKLQERIRKVLNMPDLTVQLEALTDKDTPGMLTEDEQMRRYKDMSRIYGEQFAMPERYTLVLNRANKSVQAIAQMEEGEKQELLIAQVFDLARLSSRPLEGDELKAFMKRSNRLIDLLAQ
ncbi:MAG: molecular chaperone HtpG [Clostridiales bacterium]|jgi:molecular chaperone HtpG|nr:molecular chaperone HtpG [Clostridiales bacterium]